MKYYTMRGFVLAILLGGIILFGGVFFVIKSYPEGEISFFGYLWITVLLFIVVLSIIKHLSMLWCLDKKDMKIQSLSHIIITLLKERSKCIQVVEEEENDEM